MFGFWFVIQFLASTVVMKRIIPGYAKFSAADKEDVVIRACSIVNSFIMMGSAAVFLYGLVLTDWTLPSDLYLVHPVPAYRFFRTAISAYFAWDVFVCWKYRWSTAWKVHAVCSFLGSCTLLYPFSDPYAGLYTGCFEVSNAFLHSSCVLRLICQRNESSKALCEKLSPVATILEYLFAFFYTMIRVVAGTYVTGTWLQHAVGYLINDFQSRGKPDYEPIVHDELAMVIAVVSITVLQLLQYMWFVSIVRKALGWDAPLPKAVKPKEA